MASGELGLRSGCIQIPVDLSLPASHPDEGGNVLSALHIEPFEDVEIDLDLLYWTWNPDRSFTWVGEGENGEDATGIITVVAGDVFAVLRQDGMTYVVQPDACGHIVIETDGALGPGEEECAEEEEEEDGEAPGGEGAIGLGLSSMLDSPIDDLPTFDILVVYTPEAAAARGGLTGLIGWANTQVHDLDLVFIRSGVRVMKPRLVGMADSWVTLADPGPGNPGPFMTDARHDVRDSPFTPFYREVFGADVVMVVLSQGYNALGTAKAPPLGPPLVPLATGVGIVSTSSGALATANRTPAHEILHAFGARHSCGSPPCWQTGYTAGVVTAYANEITNPLTSDLFRYTDLMASSGVPAACKLPVVGRTPRFGWTPNPGTSGSPNALCPQRERLDRYGPTGFDPGVAPLSILPTGLQNGAPVGSSTAPHNKGAVGDFLVRPFTAGLTPFELVAGWFPETLEVPSASIVFDLSPGSLGAPTSVYTDIFWNASGYAMGQPPACFPGGNCALDSNPYFLTVGTSFGASDVYADWVTSWNCFAGECFAPVDLPDLDRVYFGRLWTQLAANVWTSVEFRINHSRRLIDCSDEQAAWATTMGGECGTHVTWNAQSVLLPGTGTPAIQASIDTGGPQRGAVFAVHNDLVDPRNPWDVLLAGQAPNGDRFCCLTDWEGMGQVAVELVGSSQADLLTALGPGGTALRAEGSNVVAGAWGGQGDDWIVGTTDFDVYFYGYGSFGWDVLFGPAEGAGTYSGGAGPDLLIAAGTHGLFRGGAQSDILISTWSTAGPHSSVDLQGGEGADTICANSGRTRLLGSDSSASFVERLYVSSTWGGTFSPGSLANSFSALCGSPVHPPGWAGTCDYGPQALPAPPAGCGAATGILP